jgi:glyoxylase-like metal-dependent hydrolase (beta-lactamase superfamily II)
MTEAFTTIAIADGAWHIQDARGGVMYLVAGQDRALLIDTGWGEGDLPAHVATLTDLPLTVINTHGHRDHSPGNEQGDSICASSRNCSSELDPSGRRPPSHPENRSPIQAYVGTLGRY